MVWGGPHCAHAPAPQPQHMLTEPAPRTMRLSPLLLLLLGACAIPGGLGDRAPLSATAPQLDDEEKYSAHMPAHLRCDACRAVVYQVSSPAPTGAPPQARPLLLPRIPALAFDPPTPHPLGIKLDSACHGIAIFTPWNLHASVYLSAQQRADHLGCPTVS